MLNCFDNLYAMGGQPIGETMGYKVAARVASAINEYSMHTERVDGFNPLAVADATARKKEILLKGEGPAFMDTLTYRYSGHSPSDAMTYRTKEEMEAFRKQDPIEAYGDYLLENKVVSKKELDQFDAILEEKIKKRLSKLLLIQYSAPWLMSISLSQSCSPMAALRSLMTENRYSSRNWKIMQE